MATFSFVLIVFLAIFYGGEASTGPLHDRRVVCYAAAWAYGFPGDGRFELSDAQDAASHCTHIVILFANLDRTSLEIKFLIGLLDSGAISKAVKLKESFPRLKIMICLGGWDDGSEQYSRMVKDIATRNKFIDSVARFLKFHKLDGLDINWQFPGDRGGDAKDKENFVTLVKELREVFDRNNLILSVAVSGFPLRIALGTDGKRLSEHAHFLNVLTYEYHTKWDYMVGATTPLYSVDGFSVNDTIHSYLEMGADPSKLNLGLSAYGTTFTLIEPGTPDENVIGARVSGGFHGGYNNVDGFFAYNEVCLESDNGGWNEIWDQQSYTPFVRNGALVVSYDNPESYNAKIKLVIEHKLGGVIFYGLEKDDFKGSCKSSKKHPYPLLRAITESLLKYTSLDHNEIINLLKLKNKNINIF